MKAFFSFHVSQHNSKNAISIYLVMVSLSFALSIALFLGVVAKGERLGCGGGIPLALLLQRELHRVVD